MELFRKNPGDGLYCASCRDTRSGRSYPGALLGKSNSYLDEGRGDAGAALALPRFHDLVTVSKSLDKGGQASVLSPSRWAPDADLWGLNGLDDKWQPEQRCPRKVDWKKGLRTPVAAFRNRPYFWTQPGRKC
jgi:hypothetical protein